MVKILYVDDEPAQREVVNQLLKISGFDEVEVAEDGESGLEKARAWLPDIVVTDLRMPRMTGFELIEQLNKIPALSNIPIIILSAWTSAGLSIRAQKLGVAACIAKPFHLDDLVDEILFAHKNRTGSFDPDDVPLLVKKIHSLQAESYLCAVKLEGAKNTDTSLAELSKYTDGIIHDLRNGLGIIRNTLGFLEDDLSDSEYANDLRKISKGVGFCELVMRDLAILGKNSTFRPTETNLQEVVKFVYLLLERKLINVELIMDLENENPTIIADEGQMKQVFMNLIKNAGEAMPEGGTLTFRTRREGHMLRIELQDTGSGISPENQARLFQEFFTTKERGYGLGLHIVHAIIQRHRGTIAVESELGKGTTFIIHIPVE